jgi:23S rRNA (guanosine2251-2'-O)-methyltransferase
MARKPAWIIAKERAARQGGAPVWLFGLHAVRDALANPLRRCLTLVVTPNARDRLGPIPDRPGLAVRTADPRRFDAPLDPGSVHQGAALEVLPLDWGPLAGICAPDADAPVLLLDRVTDPHNVGAILRSAEVFGARAVIAPHRHAAPETGALAKAASGALERMPYLRVPNLAEAMAELRLLGYRLIGLDGTAALTIESALADTRGAVGLVLGAEGPGMRQRTRSSCDLVARIAAAGSFGSLNVSNAAAVALYAARRAGRGATG